RYRKHACNLNNNLFDCYYKTIHSRNIGTPASLYSSHFFIANARKWGIYQINMIINKTFPTICDVGSTANQPNKATVIDNSCLNSKRYNPIPVVVNTSQ